MDELMQFIAKNYDKLVRADRESLVRVASQIGALKKAKPVSKKAAAKQAIEKILDGLSAIAQTKYYYYEGYTSPYADPKNKDTLQKAVAIARRLLREA